MPPLTDAPAIRAILRRDPVWSVYALGDLAPHMFAKARWFTPDLTLVLHDYGTSILFATGPGSVREALDYVTWPAHLQVREDVLEAIARYARVTSSRPMWRMGWRGTPPPMPTRAVRLGANDVPTIARLYDDGAASGESPDFFFPSMVTDGVFFGVYERDALAAVAGTHLVCRDEGVAAIGNVYTRRDGRGRGLGRIVTAAVIGGLGGIETIGLNVRADNSAAIHLYESLGFVRHCRFVEALATGWR